MRAALKMPGGRISNAVNENAMLVAKGLEHDPDFAGRLARGELKIIPARYNLATGKVVTLPAE